MSDFYNLKFQDEAICVDNLIATAQKIPLRSDLIKQQTQVFIETIRARKKDAKGFNSLMQSYDLTSDEGLALMGLAEALLRVPDANTANALIEDKLSDGDWSKLFEQSSSAMGAISGYGLSFSQKIMDSMLGKVGMPFIRKACVEAMQIMGKTFVLGHDIEHAIQNAQASLAKGYLYNFDMLGEGARTSKDAQTYFESYCHAIETIGASFDNSGKNVLNRSGISIKLSALYPRYEFAQKDKAVPILSEKLLKLCTLASRHKLNLTVDAEECDRLTTSLDIIKTIIENPLLKTWDGFGFAVQAYHKRAIALIDMAIELAKSQEKKISIRLVKGAYWDSEIKHAQIEGLEGYPVFTRKENTDLSYMVCAKKLLDNRDVIYPMLGTHNAQSVATILDMAGNNKQGFIFQRLHGMGEQLYDQVLSINIPVSVYAPVGTHKFLLAYLVRRLLENGANSSFVNKVYDEQTPIEALSKNPLDLVSAHQGEYRNPKIPLPNAVYSDRKNSKGIDLSDALPTEKFINAYRSLEDKSLHGYSIIDGKNIKETIPFEIENPSNRHDRIGKIYFASDETIDTAYDGLGKAFHEWNSQPVSHRADIIEKIADVFEEKTDELMSILIREAGKTIPDAIAEVREAVDFCRYYAHRARIDFNPQILEGPTGEKNTYLLEGRGIFVCISPWNFPLAIFTGQIVAALVSGNCVMAKPAEQTPAIATYAVQLMLKAGLPKNVIALVQGDGKIGSKIISHAQLSGVAFTGSTEVAKIIQKQIANNHAAIIPLIAETGGLNAMIVDSTALPEQVVDDVIHSAFGSAGQRCSALRILCVQDNIAHEIITMIKGAMDHLVVGDPCHLSTDIGPIIDDEAKLNLVTYRNQLEGTSKDFYAAPYDERLDGYGHFFTPIMAVMESIDDIQHEAFGPVLHIITYKEKNLDSLIDALNAKNYGLTFGLHTRIIQRQNHVSQAVKAGNIYINRGQTGAVVGVQPFGGRGLSGTGPKAGGPRYLLGFTTEKSISNNITASGGNTALVNL